MTSADAVVRLGLGHHKGRLEDDGSVFLSMVAGRVVYRKGAGEAA